MRRTLLLNGIIYFLILLFLYTGVSKVIEFSQFSKEMSSSPIFGPIAGFATWALPTMEFIISILLLIPTLRLKGLYVCLAVLVAFTIYLVLIILYDSNLSCSCGGLIQQMSPWQHLSFNISCITASLIAIQLYRKEQTTRKRLIQCNIATGLSIIIIGISIWASSNNTGLSTTGMEGRSLPSIDLLLIDSTTHLSTEYVPSGKPFVIIGFSPFCTHCQDQTKDIIEHIDQFKKTSIYFLTSFKYSDMKAFYNAFQLNKYPNMVLCQDKQSYFFSYFKVAMLPFITVFDSNRRLKQVINGKVNAAILLSSLNE